MDKTQFIKAGRFIDGTGTDACKDTILTVTGSVIAAIGSSEDIAKNNEETIVDLSHCTILPPLVDCSVVLSHSPSVEEKVRLAMEKSGFKEKKALLEKHLNYCHVHGVQGVADSDDLSGLVPKYLEESNQQAVITLKTSGCLIRTRQDYSVKNMAGNDFLKIQYSTDIEDDQTQPPLLSPDDLNHIVQNRAGKKVVVVANGAKHVQEALDAGCDAIEQGYGMGTDNLKKMADRNVLWISNVLQAKNGLDSSVTGGDIGCRFSQRYVASGKPIPGAEKFWKTVLAKQLAQLHTARELGVTTAVGTGAGNVGILHGESMVEEMKLFIKAGYSQEETIQCASKNGAEFFSMKNLGTLSVGKKATFLITRGTVKQLPRKLSYLEGIFVNGMPSTNYQKNPIKSVG